MVIVTKQFQKQLTNLNEIQSLRDKNKQQKINQIKPTLSNLAPGKLPCQYCINSMIKNPGPAGFQCLNCRNMLLCANCSTKHNKSHKIIKYLDEKQEDQLLAEFDEKLTGVSANNLNCPEHKLNVYTRYCYNCDAPMCEKCLLLEE